MAKRLLTIGKFRTMINSVEQTNAMKESSRFQYGFRERMAGVNPYTIDFEAVPEQQFPTVQYYLVGSDVFPRYRDTP